MTMIYNGMELPALPQDAQYDKALIFYAADNIISLIYTDDPFSLRTLEPLNFDGAYRNWEVYSLTEDGTWGNKNSGYSNYDGAVVNGIIWANYDVLDPDGNVYLAASEPLTLFVVTHTVNADLLERGVRPRVDVVQGDCLTRRVEFVLTAGGVPWTPPDDTAAALSYVRPDGAGKVYDKLPDGTPAYTVSGNRVRFTLLPEMLTVAGEVQAALRILRASDKHLISTFVFDIVVEAEPSWAVMEGGGNPYGAAKTITAEKEISVVTVTAEYGGSYTSTTVIELNEDDTPVSVTANGETTILTWKGFD